MRLVFSGVFGIGGVMSYAREGLVQFPIAALLAGGILISIALGSRVDFSLTEVTLRRGLAVLLMAVAAELFFKK